MKLITATQAAEGRDQDNYPSEHISVLTIDQISQMIEEAMPYTNFIVLEGLLYDTKIENELKKAGYTVETMGYIGSVNKEYYTIIQWPII
jgi:hypothetical protein